MNNVFEFTFMPELDPSQHPSPPPHLTFFTPPPLLSSPFFSLSSQSTPFLFTPLPFSSLHYSSSSELNLISPLGAPPYFSSLLHALPLYLCQAADRKLYGIFLTLKITQVFPIPGPVQLAAH